MTSTAVIYMNQTLQRDNSFIEFKEELKEALLKYQFRKLPHGGKRPSAVMILIKNINSTPSVLLTKRSEKVSTHKGQMSLPGGSFDSEDIEILNCAFRETEEEVGVSKDKIDFLGRFDDYVSIFGFHIATFAGVIDSETTYKISEDEIDDYIEVPLSIFINKEYYKTEIYTHEDQDYTIYFYKYKNFEIWGLTARILTDFAKKILAK